MSRSNTVERRHRQWLDRLLGLARRGHIVSVGMPVILLLAGTALVFANLRRAEQEKLAADFEVQTTNVYNGLRDRFDVYRETVESIASLYATGHKLERKRFRAFVARALSQYDGIQALGWNPRVLRVERSSYEQAAQDDGLTDFQFKQWTPDGDSVWTPSKSDWANEYVPAYLLEPIEKNQSALGIDVASDPTRREALQQARDTGRAVATARITLAQDTGEQAGFLIFVPVYAVGSATDTIIERRESLRGFAVGVFRVSDIVGQVLADREFNGIHLQISDQSADDGQRLLFDNLPQPNNKQSGTSQPLSGNNIVSVFEHDVGGRRWQVRFSPALEYLQARSRWDSWLILIGGILSSLLLGVVLQLTIGRADEIEALVRLRTEQLHQTNEQLEREIRERDLARSELQAKAAELEKSNEHLTRFNNSASGRELRMVELKREINELLESAGQQPRYDISFAGK